MNKKLHVEIVKNKKSFPNHDARDLVWNHLSAGFAKSLGIEMVRCKGIPSLQEHIHSYTVCSDLITVGETPSLVEILMYLL